MRILQQQEKYIAVVDSTYVVIFLKIHNDFLSKTKQTKRPQKTKKIQLFFFYTHETLS